MVIFNFCGIIFFLFLIINQLNYFPIFKIGSNFNLNNANNSSTSNTLTQQSLRKLKIFTKILDTPPGVYTQYKPFLQKDKTIIRNILSGVKKQRPVEVQSAILRRHLLELTQSFMIPLERYMASLMPLQKDISGNL